MAERNDLSGWSMRAAGRYAGLSVNAVGTLLRLDPHREGSESGPLSPVDVLVVRVLAELAANRSVNKSSRDERSNRLAERDLRAISATRLAYAEGRLSPTARLLAYGSTALIAVKDLDVLTALDEHPGEAIAVLPVGVWVAQIRDIEASRGENRPIAAVKAVS